MMKMPTNSAIPAKTSRIWLIAVVAWAIISRLVGGELAAGDGLASSLGRTFSTCVFSAVCGGARRRPARRSRRTAGLAEQLLRGRGVEQRQAAARGDAAVVGVEDAGELRVAHRAVGGDSGRCRRPCSRRARRSAESSATSPAARGAAPSSAGSGGPCRPGPGSSWRRGCCSRRRRLAVLVGERGEAGDAPVAEATPGSAATSSSRALVRRGGVLPSPSPGRPWRIRRAWTATATCSRSLAERS